MAQLCKQHQVLSCSPAFAYASHDLQLSNGLLSLELSTTDSGELSAALSGSTLSEEGEVERAASDGTLPVSGL